MGAITRGVANGITTSGVVLKSIINNDSMDNVTAFPVGIPTDDGITLISSQTASNSASISFTSGLTSTYKAYKFLFSNIHARTQSMFTFNLSTNSGSNYNVTKTSTNFTSFHDEANTDAGLSYRTAADLAQSTAFQNLGGYTELLTDADASLTGSMILFNPSSTTYVKHFIANTQVYGESSYSTQSHIAGYGNTTSAINAIQFKLVSGNFDGTIYLYGIK